jgi:hypothetical protein
MATIDNSQQSEKKTNCAIQNSLISGSCAAAAADAIAKVSSIDAAALSFRNNSYCLSLFACTATML